MWPRISALLLSPRFKLALALLACAVSFGLGIRWQRGEDAIEQQQLVARAANQRRKQEEAIRLRDQENEARIRTLEAALNERTRRAYEAIGDHPEPVPANVLRDLDAAARAP